MQRFYIFLVMAFCCAVPAMAQVSPETSRSPNPRYLAFQIFTPAPDSAVMQQNIPAVQNWPAAIIDLKNRVGIARSDVNRLAFILGPIAFDHSDDYVRSLISTGFKVALETGVAVGFHIDDSMFWGRLKELNTPDNLEWLDWKRTLNTGRRLDWSSKPEKIMPQLCVNSRQVKEAVAKRASLIGQEVNKGIQTLRAAGRTDLYAGVIAGWETMIGYDFETGKELGYCALTHAGFSAQKPPSDTNSERINITRSFINLWADSLIKGGVPQNTVYSHITFAPEVTNLTPPETAFCAQCMPGFSTYPAPGLLTQLTQEVKKHGSSWWISAEGTAIDPAQAEHGGAGMDMETYLGSLFNNGAKLVNIFGLGVGDRDNAFRKTAESENAIAAYRKFVKGVPLKDTSSSTNPVTDLPGKIQKIQSALPAYLQANGPAKIKPMMERLDKHLQNQELKQASALADDILKLLKP